MIVDQTTLAQRLRDAREGCGLTQDEVALNLQLPRTAVVQIEAAKRAVSSLELSRLAKLYHRRIDSFFEDAEMAKEEPPLKVLFRADSAIGDDPQAQAAVSKTIELCRIGGELDRLLGRRPRLGPPAYACSAPSRKAEAVEQGTLAAEEERRRLEIGDAPIADMAELISAQEIWAAAAAVRDDVSGVFLNHPDLGMVLLVNDDHVLARQRFSYAHEYAHGLFDRDEPVTVSTFEKREDLREVRANAFAAAFLLPANGVTAMLRFLNKGTASRTHAWVYDLGMEEKSSPAIQAEERAAPGSQTVTAKDVAVIAHHFGASYLAATYRIRNLGFVNQPECEQLISQEESGRAFLRAMNLTDYEVKDPKPNRELRNQVAYLAFEAYRRDDFTRGQMLELSELLEIPGPELLRLATDSK